MNVSFSVFVAVLTVGASVTPSLCTAAAAQTSPTRLVVNATFTPNPPSARGTETIVVSVRDAAGKSVSGATVEIATSMPTMSMKGARLVARESGRGTYTAHAKLGYATRWAFDIAASASGRSGMAHVEKVLK